MASAKLQAALAYARMGWRVFPVGLDGRSPLIKGGCHSASSDLAVVDVRWRRWPSANIALACGPDSGVLALDIDAKGDADGFARLEELQAEFGRLPETVTSRTPSGGAHLLFAHPAGPSPENRVGIKRYGPDGERRVYHGLDVRAAGGSICLPPSAKASGGYRWERSPGLHDLAPVPPWLNALMRSAPPPRPRKPLSITGSPERMAKYVCAAVEGECSDVAAATAPGRNQRLFIASAKLGELVGASLLRESDAQGALEHAAEDCGLVREDGWHSVRATIASGLKRGIESPREVAC